MKNTLYTRILVFNYSIIRTFSLTKWTNQDLKFPWGSHTRSSRSLQKSGLTLDLSHCNHLNCLCPCVLWHVPMTPLLVSLCMDPRDCLCGASSCQALWQTQGRRQGRQCCQPHQAPHWVRVPLSCTCRLRSRPHTESAPPPPPAVPVGWGAGVLVLLELHTHHVEELIWIRTQVMHQVHEVLHSLLHNDCALEMNKKEQTRKLVRFLFRTMYRTSKNTVRMWVLKALEFPVGCGT